MGTLKTNLNLQFTHNCYPETNKQDVVDQYTELDKLLPTSDIYHGSHFHATKFASETLL